jgi:hypothetical protein
LCILLLGLVSAAATSCGPEGDSSWVPPVETNVDPREGADGRCVRPAPDGKCAPDVRPTLVDCAAAERGFEFLTPAIFDFSSTTTSLYSYSDGTSEFLQPSGYEPDIFAQSTRCGILNAAGVLEPDQLKAGELHIWGGPFREWGGGMGRSMQGYAASAGCAGIGATAPPDDGEGPCPAPDARIEAVPTTVATDAGGVLRSGAYDRLVDVRAWDGISFWARLGPGSDPGFRVSLGDRQLDDDISYLEAEAFKSTGGNAPGPTCGRVLECGCRNHRPCTPDPVDQQLFCWDPARGDRPPSELRAALPADATDDDFPYFFPYEKCGATMCDQPFDAFGRADLIFATPANPMTPGTASCQEYTFQNDFTALYCYDPNDASGLAVAAAYERCGDVWAKPIGLTEQWQFFTVPFTELRQEGWGKEFQYLDLSRIALTRFTWAVGWVDFWLDDVRFYRTPRPPVAAN